MRDRVLERARIQNGDVVLDVGTGTGLLALGALDLVGADGAVICLDISVDCLEELRGATSDPRLSFLVGDAAVLPLPDDSADVCVLRSVLIYVREKADAARELHRVLRDGGRVSLFEPVNRRNTQLWELVDFGPLAERVAADFHRRWPADDPMHDFDVEDMERWFADAGFREIDAEVEVTSMTIEPESALHGVGAPGRPSLVEAWAETFSPQEVEELAAAVRAAGRNHAAVARALPHGDEGMRPSFLPARAVVVGMARSGRAAAAELARREVDVVAVDAKLGNDADLTALENVELVVKSPGVPRENALVVAARERGVSIWSEVELGYRLLSAGTRLVGVTGTNGKTTTVELLGAMFRAAGREVTVAGNVGRPLTGSPPAEWVVCELSSFQLEDVHELACEIAVLLNLEPDHLDRHGTFDAYRDAKLRIFERAGTAIVPRELGLPGTTFARDDPLPAEPRIPGAHNRENAVAATAAARAAGLPDEAIAEALQTFPGVAHRLETVAELDGVLYVNDSKATNVAAARRGLAAIDRPLHVILGGSLKGEDFASLADAIGPNVKAVYLIGEAADELDVALRPTGVRIERCGTLGVAVERAANAAVAGDAVLLSPACASFDAFRDFEHRGEEFRRLVQNLEG